MTSFSDFLTTLGHVASVLVACVFLFGGDDLHAWLIGLGILVATVLWDVAKIAAHAGEQTVLLTAIAERE